MNMSWTVLQYLISGSSTHRRFWLNGHFLGITKPCTQLHPAPPSSFQPLISSLQHSQQYSNQNIARNWDTENDTHGILEVLIPNADLDFWNSDPKIHFWANLGPEKQNCSFCLKIGTHGISRIAILIPTLVFWISNEKSIFGQIWVKKVKVAYFACKLAHMVSWGYWFLFRH